MDDRRRINPSPLAGIRRRNDGEEVIIVMRVAISGLSIKKKEHARGQTNTLA